MDVNVALTRANLDMLAPEDFLNPALRMGFSQLSRAATGQSLSPADDDWLVVIADDPIVSDDEVYLREEIVRTALRQRVENLQRDRSALRYMVEEAQASGDRSLASQYNLRLQDVSTRHLRAQKALRLRSAMVVS